MMLPLCTMVTLGLLWSMAYWMALRIRRSVPSRDTGLMPMPEVLGKRILAGAQFVLQKRDELLGLVGFGGNSMPA